MEYTDEQIKNINKTLHDQGEKFFEIPPVIFTMGDILKVQDWASRRYTNFNGGFGLSNDRVGHYKVQNNIEVSFISDKQLKEDIAYNGKSENFVFNQRHCVEKLGWLEFLILICHNEGLQFKYDRSIINEILSL